MGPEELTRMLAELAREHAPEATFSPPLQVGETTVICASSVNCLAGSRGPNLLISLRASPCAVIVISPGRCTVLPLGAPGTVDRLLEVAPRLLDLLEGKARATTPDDHAVGRSGENRPGDDGVEWSAENRPGDDGVGWSGENRPSDKARPGAGPHTSVPERPQ